MAKLLHALRPVLHYWKFCFIKIFHPDLTNLASVDHKRGRRVGNEPSLPLLCGTVGSVTAQFDVSEDSIHHVLYALSNSSHTLLNIHKH